MSALSLRLGFSFSAGFIDYFLNFNHATRLRLRVASQAAIDAAALKRLGAAGLVY
jgi:phosphotransferase system IIB component